MSATESESRTQSPMSPGREIRIKENEEICGLNSRLAQYIDVVRRLQTENETLRIRISRTQETSTQERTQVRQIFESEINGLRDENTNLLANKAVLETEIEQLQKKNEEWQPLIQDLEQMKNNLVDKNQDLKDQLDNCNLDLQKALQDVENLASSLADCRLENEILQKQLQDCQGQLEGEILRRAEAESAREAMAKTLQFEKNIFEESLRGSCLLKVTEIEELEKRKDTEAQFRIQEVLDEMRNQHGDQILEYKREKDAFYAFKLRELRNQYASRDSELMQCKRKLCDKDNEIRQLVNDLNDLRDQLQNKDDRIRDLDNALVQEKLNADDRENDLQNQLDNVRNILNDHLDEYQSLLDEKLTLDREIEAYRRMIETEETRMNIRPTSPGGKPIPPGLDNYCRGDQMQKRKIVTEEYFSSETMQTTKAIGIEIIEADAQGQFVCLKNHDTRERAMGNFEIRREAEGSGAYSLFLAPDFVLQPGAIATIYGSACCGSVPEDPNSFVANDIQFWPVGDNFSTTLFDAEGVELAARVNKRTVTENEEMEMEPPMALDRCVIS